MNEPPPNPHETLARVERPNVGIFKVDYFLAYDVSLGHRIRRAKRATPPSMPACLRAGPRRRPGSWGLAPRARAEPSDSREGVEAVVVRGLGASRASSWLTARAARLRPSRFARAAVRSLRAPGLRGHAACVPQSPRHSIPSPTLRPARPILQVRGRAGLRSVVRPSLVAPPPLRPPNPHSGSAGVCGPPFRLPGSPPRGVDATRPPMQPGRPPLACPPPRSGPPPPCRGVGGVSPPLFRGGGAARAKREGRRRAARAGSRKSPKARNMPCWRM